MTITYAPEHWTVSQAAFHHADTLEDAFHQASCLAGGWYRRAVAIDYRITANNDEEYQLRPADSPTPEGWTAIYEVKAVL